MSEQKNLFIAVFLSIAVLIGFNYFFERPSKVSVNLKKEPHPQKKVKIENPLVERANPTFPTISSQNAPRIEIKTDKVKGSISLKGALLDDLTLLSYKENTKKDSPFITLLSSKNPKNSYFVSFGWINEEGKPLVDHTSQWIIKKESSQILTPTTPISLFFENDHVLIERIFSIDNDYLLTITDKLKNKRRESVHLKPYGRVTRIGTPKVGGYYILHEGALGFIDGKLKEFDYKTLVKEKATEFSTLGGWLGFTDKYWLVSLMAPEGQSLKTRFSGDDESETYSAEALLESKVIAGGETLTSTEYVFAGPKILRLLDSYEGKLGLEHFDLAVDFGWFYFLTKPLFKFLEALHRVLGNLGLAIIVLTIFVKLALYPLAHKSFYSMARMKSLQPKLEKLKSQYGHDKVKMNQELITLYKKEKVNPMSGCLPLLIQAPIFFCLYKVFFVTIEMRHAPFFGWIQDLSAPDPTSFFNLFGLLPWGTPSFFQIGALPLFMGLTMYVQQKMNPQPTDPAQAKAMLIMPVMFTFLFASFPAGLVLYWAWSNILAILQQWLMTRSINQSKPITS